MLTFADECLLHAFGQHANEIARRTAEQFHFKLGQASLRLGCKWLAQRCLIGRGRIRINSGLAKCAYQRSAEIPTSAEIGRIRPISSGSKLTVLPDQLDANADLPHSQVQLPFGVEGSIACVSARPPGPECDQRKFGRCCMTNKDTTLAIRT